MFRKHPRRSLYGADPYRSELVIGYPLKSLVSAHDFCIRLGNVQYLPARILATLDNASEVRRCAAPFIRFALYAVSVEN